MLAAMTLAIGAAAAAQPPPADPAARATRRAQMQELRQKDPVAFATARAERRAQRMAERKDKPARGVVLEQPLPLPVAVGGAPHGGACPADKACTLQAAPPSGQVLVVTAAWGASSVRCDGVALALPPGGAPIAPWCRCERELVLEGAGAGYAAFATANANTATVGGR